MSEPTSPNEGGLGAAERLHPLFLLTGLGGSLRGLLGGYAAIGYLAVSGRLSMAIIGGIALLAFMAVGIILYWTRFEFRVGANDIRIDSGILSRTHRSIPFDRIQDVDITQGPVARLFGLAAVRFETGGGGAKEEGVLHAIALQRAGEIRELVRARRAGAAVAAAEAAEEPAPVFVMGLNRVMLAGLFNFSLAVLAGLFGLSQTFGDAMGFDPLSARFWRDLLAASAPVQQFVLAHRFVTIIAGLGLLMLIGAATGIVRTLLREHGFRLDRTEAGLRRRRGLLTLTDVTLPLKRAQAAIVATGPVRESFGWSELRLQNLGGDEAGTGDHVVAPLADRSEVDAILTELKWRPLPPQPAWNRVSRAYIWIRGIAVAPFLLIIGLNLFVFAATPLLVDESMRASVAALVLPGVLVVAVPFALLLLAFAARWLDWRRTGYLIDGDRLLIRRGWWKRRIVILPVSKVQSVEHRESAVSRWFGTATLLFGVAGGSILATPTIPALPRETARKLREELLSRGP